MGLLKSRNAPFQSKAAQRVQSWANASNGRKRCCQKAEAYQFGSGCLDPDSAADTQCYQNSWELQEPRPGAPLNKNARYKPLEKVKPRTDFGVQVRQHGN